MGYSMIKVSDIKNSISEIQKHYDKHVNNKYVKKFTLNLDISPTVIQNMNLILGANFVYIDTKGAIEDLYCGVKAVCDFINEIQTNIIPELNSYTNITLQSNMSENDKILSQMAIKNYPMNIKILSNMLYKVFNMIIDYDIATFPRDPAFKRVEYFEEIRKVIDDMKD
jgi:hypothetical protein